jgi:hypothetical protein
MMSQEQFVRQVAVLVAGLQVPVSIRGGPAVLGAGADAWQALLHEVNGGFGWTTTDKCHAKFTELLEGTRHG